MSSFADEDALPGSPTGIDGNRHAMDRVRVGARKIDSGTGEFFRLQEVPAGRRQCLHVRDVRGHVLAAEMGIQRRGDIARRK